MSRHTDFAASSFVISRCGLWGCEGRMYRDTITAVLVDTFVFMFSDCRRENLPKLPKWKALWKDFLKSMSPSFVVVLRLGMSGVISVMHGRFLSWNWSVIKVWLELPGIFLMGCQTHGKGCHVSLSNPLGRVHTPPPLRVLMYELYFSKLQLLEKF